MSEQTEPQDPPADPPARKAPAKDEAKEGQAPDFVTPRDNQDEAPAAPTSPNEAPDQGD